MKPTPPHQDPDLLRDAYERADGSIAGTADEFDVGYDAVRDWLIRFGIHNPPKRRSYVDLLTQMEPDEFEQLLKERSESERAEPAVLAGGTNGGNCSGP